MTEQLHFRFSLSCIGEGNGSPLQCSCLGNPRTEEPGGLPSLGSHRVGHDWSDAATASSVNSKEPACQCRRYKRHMGLIPESGRSLEEGMATHSSILAWRILWPEEHSGLQSRSCTESDTTQVTWHTHDYFRYAWNYNFISFRSQNAQNTCSINTSEHVFRVIFIVEKINWILFPN